MHVELKSGLFHKNSNSERRRFASAIFNSISFHQLQFFLHFLYCHKNSKHRSTENFKYLTLLKWVATFVKEDLTACVDTVIIQMHLSKKKTLTPASGHVSFYTTTTNILNHTKNSQLSLLPL